MAIDEWKADGKQQNEVFAFGIPPRELKLRTNPFSSAQRTQMKLNLEIPLRLVCGDDLS
jgi:hypothetical protein